MPLPFPRLQDAKHPLENGRTKFRRRRASCILEEKYSNASLTALLFLLPGIVVCQHDSSKWSVFRITKYSQNLSTVYFGHYGHNFEISWVVMINMDFIVIFTVTPDHLSLRTNNLMMTESETLLSAVAPKE